MAANNSSYLPDLGRCLSGDVAVLSWGDVLDALLSHDSIPSPAIRSFFAHPTAKKHLSQPNPTFAGPSAQSKATFESQTSAVNVTPAASKQYNIEEIKADTSWLSKEVEIDEVAALRLTILEWQSRPKIRLKSGFSDAEFASLRHGLGDEYVDALDLTPGGSFGRDDVGFDSQDARRARLLQTYFADKADLGVFSYEFRAFHKRQREETEKDGSASAGLWLDLLPEYQRQAREDIVHETCSFIQSQMERLRGRNWSVEEQHASAINDGYATSILRQIATSLETLLLEVYPSFQTTSSDCLLQWLHLMAPIEYFAAFSSDLLRQQKIITTIQTTASVVTAALINPQQALQMLDSESSEALAAKDSKAFFLDTEHLAEVNELLLTAAGSANAFASPGVLAWGLILVEMRGQATNARESRESRQVQRAIDRNGLADSSGRRSSTSSTGSLNQSVYEDVMNEIMAGSFVDDPVDSLLHAALRGANIFSYLSQLCSQIKGEGTLSATYKTKAVQELIRLARPIVGYESDILDAQLAVLSTSTEKSYPRGTAYDPVTNFIGDNFLMESFFDAALSRFPYEALPFLRLCKALSQAQIFDEDGTQYITFRLRRLDTFTQAAVGGFEAYTTIREDENANLVSLENAVGMLDYDNKKLLTQHSNASSQDIIPAQTIGEVISESFPPIIQWQNSYSGFALLGKWLEMQSQSRLEIVLSPFESPEEVASSILNFLNQLLTNTYTETKSSKNATQAKDLCLAILSEAADLLEQDNSIVSCVSEILEQQLQLAGRRSHGTNELLVSCLDFFTVLSKFLPAETWSLLAKSSLFNSGGSARNIASVIANSEGQSGEYKLLESFAQLFSQCVDVVLTLAAADQQLQAAAATVMQRNRKTVPQRLNGAIMQSFTESMHAVFATGQQWSFRDLQQKYRVIRMLSDAFFKVLTYVFGNGEAIGSTNPLTASLSSAAEFLVRTLLEDDLDSSAASPIVRFLTSTFMDTEKGEPANIAGCEAICSCLRLAQILHRYQEVLGRPASSALSAQFMDVLPLLVRISQTSPKSTQATYELIWGLVSSRHLKPTPSLLGHLGSVSCISFLDRLKFDTDYSQTAALQSAAWKLLSRLVTVDQQWLAIVLVTGSPPGREIKRDNSIKLQTRGKPILEQALDQLEQIPTLHPQAAAGMLQFLAEAQQNWPSVTDAILSHHDLFPALVRYVSAKDVYDHNDLDQALHNRVAAAIIDLAVIHLHRLMAVKDEKIFATFIPLLTWLTESAVDVAAYNASLHGNLRKNFKMKYPGLDTSMLKRTELLNIAYGEDYFYDLSLADQFLGEDQYWNSVRIGFRAEFQRANINLSIVDSELVLIKSFQYLCLEHGYFFAQHRDVAKIMAQIVTKCLKANTQACLNEALFDGLFQMRADMAVVLVRPLVNLGVKGSDFVALLSVAWDAARFRSGSYEKAILNDDLVYWQSILSVILMSVQFHVQKKPRSTPLGQGTSIEEIDPSCALYCEIAAVVVGNGLQSIVAALQDQRGKQGRETSGQSLIGLRDVNLLLNFLQAILRLPTLPQFEAQLSEALIASGTAQSALLLYSWSHLLLEDNQPVFADLAVRLLASMSTLPQLAEELAVEGILNRLSTARITLTLQNVPNGVMHLDKRPNLAWLYSLWCHGLLPICLNLLHTIGAGVAAEVSGFLNQFPQQLSRASLAFSLTPPSSREQKDGITLDAASEASTLALISRILETFKEAGPAAGIDPMDIAPLAGYDEHRKMLAEDIRDVIALDHAVRRQRTIPMSERETAWQKLKDNLLDQKVLKELKQAIKCLNQNGDESG